mgnify:FL=1
MRFIESLFIKYQNINSTFKDPDLLLGIIISIIGTILSLVFMIIWFRSWEGKRAEE